nr:hypothetical protein OH837_48970 [Streptomyces canus]
MPRIPPLLADALLAGGIALTIAVVWIYTVGPISPSAVVICAALAVLASLAAQAATAEIRRRRRAPLMRRWNTGNHRKPRRPGGAA